MKGESQDESDMVDVPRPVMLLFMGDRDEHAITAIQYFYPSSVHIVTSDKFAEKYEKSLTEWSQLYQFRRGLVSHIGDLFEPSSAESLLQASFRALSEERANGENEGEGLLVGITGGTTHMAVTGAYLSQIVGGTAFYVMRPPEGQPAVPRRDVLMFPALDSLRMALATTTPDIDYLMTNESGEVGDLLQNSMMTGGYLADAVEKGLLVVDSEENWAVTELGRASFGFASRTAAWGEVSMLLETLGRQRDDDDNSDAYIG